MPDQPLIPDVPLNPEYPDVLAPDIPEYPEIPRPDTPEKPLIPPPDTIEATPVTAVVNVNVALFVLVNATTGKSYLPA